MRIVRMFFCGVVCGVAILSLLCIFSVPMANAQGLEIDGEAKVKITLVETLTAAKNTERAKFYVRLEVRDQPSTCGGMEYDIYSVEDTGEGNTCDLDLIGWVDTCGANEATAWGFLEFQDAPKAGQTIFVYFNGVVGNKKLKSIGASCWVDDGGPFNIMLASKFKLQAKEKDLTKKLDCTMP